MQTKSINLTEKEIEEIMTALNYYDVEFNIKHKDQADNETSKKFWQEKNDFSVELYLKLYDLSK